MTIYFMPPLRIVDLEDGNPVTIFKGTKELGTSRTVEQAKELCEEVQRIYLLTEQRKREFSN